MRDVSDIWSQCQSVGPEVSHRHRETRNTRSNDNSGSRTNNSGRHKTFVGQVPLLSGQVSNSIKWLDPEIIGFRNLKLFCFCPPQSSLLTPHSALSLVNLEWVRCLDGPGLTELNSFYIELSRHWPWPWPSHWLRWWLTVWLLRLSGDHCLCIDPPPPLIISGKSWIVSHSTTPSVEKSDKSDLS